MVFICVIISVSASTDISKTWERVVNCAYTMWFLKYKFKCRQQNYKISFFEVLGIHPDNK